MTNHCTHEQSKALKEIGFDMPVRDCIYHGIKGDMNYIKKMTREYNHNDIIETTSLPTHAEALEWFREKKGIDGWVESMYDFDNVKQYIFIIHRHDDSRIRKPTHHEATSALIDKMIETTKQQKVFRKCSDCNTEFVSNQRCPECNPMG